MQGCDATRVLHPHDDWQNGRVKNKFVREEPSITRTKARPLARLTFRTVLDNCVHAGYRLTPVCKVKLTSLETASYFALLAV